MRRHRAQRTQQRARGSSLRCGSVSGSPRAAGGGELGTVEGGLGTEDGGGSGPVGVCGDEEDVGGQDGAEGAGRDGVVGFGGKGVEFGFDRVDFRHDGGDAGVLGEGGG